MQFTVRWLGIIAQQHFKITSHAVIYIFKYT